MPALSVVICAHNPRREYLHRVLAALDEQTLPKDRWELLLVDNASEGALADQYDLSWHPAGRHIRENSIGLTLARFRGIDEAHGDLLIFVDDDNVLARDFLERAATIIEHYPFLGVFGPGHLEPEFEAEPSPEIRSRVQMLALRSVSSPRWSNNPRDFASIPWGAGICVNRQVADQYRPFMEKLGVIPVLGRKGRDLLCGEDDVFSWVSASLNRGFGIFPQLRITHLIAANRVSRDYILRLTRGHHFSSGVLHFMLSGVQPRRIDAYRYFHLFLHGMRNGWFSMRCQWEMSRGEDGAARFIQSRGLEPAHGQEPVVGESG